MADQKSYEHQLIAIEKLKNYIIAHLNDDLNLEKLSKIAHYSPFHLQKIFKQLVGESPKQYIGKLRTEVAIKHLILKPDTPIQAIAKMCSFSSASVFARYIKKATNHSPEQLRLLPFNKQIKILQSINPDSKIRKNAPLLEHKSDALTINTCFVKQTQGIFTTSVMHSEAAIKQAFIELKNNVTDTGLLNDKCTFYGLVSPHQGSEYTCFLALENITNRRLKHNTTSITEGIYATYKVTGGFHDSMKALHYFYENWLPKSAYKLSGISGFESFEQDPTKLNYNKLNRRVFIPLSTK